MKSGSLFSQIFVTLITTMLIPFVTIFSLYFFTEKITNELVHRSSNRVLSQFFAVVDNTMFDASNTVLEIGNNKQCQTYSQYATHQPDKSSHQIIDVQDALREKNNVSYYDLFVYFPKDDRIISATNGSVTSDYYFMAHYAKESYNREDFKQILEMSIPRPHMFRLEGRQNYLCIGMRQTFNSNRERDFVVVLVMRPQYISDLTLESQLQDEGALLIYDWNKTLLVGNNGGRDCSIEWFDGEETYHEFFDEKGDYFIQVQKASSLEGYYAYATSAQMFSESLKQMRLGFVLGMLACLVTGVFLVFRGTSKVYTPIKNVVQKIGSDNVYDRTAFNEIDLIEKVVDSNKEDKQLISRLNRKSIDVQKKRFIQSLILGTYPAEDLENALEKNEIDILSEYFAVGIVCVGNRGTIESGQQDFIIQNVFEEIADRYGKGYVIQSSDNNYVLMLNFKDFGMTQKGPDEWKEACQFLEKYYEATISVYFSEPHTGIDKIPTAFREAVTAKNYQYLLGNVIYLGYADIKDRKFNYVSMMESKLSKVVIGYLQEKNHVVPEETFVNQILEMSEINADSSIDTVECFKYEMFSILSKAVVIYNGTEQSKRILEELMQAKNLDGFQRKLVELLKTLWVLKVDFSKTQDLCEKVAEYIRTQYWDTELSLKSIGDKVHMTPYYVSKLFKEEYDISISAYITKVRIEQAKKELIETDKSIRTIAEETGFLSSTVFIRTFKKVEGVTPGTYRAIKE